MIVDILQGSLSGIGSLSGDISAVPGISGAISAVSQLSGEILAAGALSGSLSSPVTLGGVITIPPLVGGVIYDGDYTVTPKAFESTTLPTAEKLMTDDVTVLEIPYYATSNVHGTTIYIADEV